MVYVDVYVLLCLQDKVVVYCCFVCKVGVVWKDYGVLQYMECVVDDVELGKSILFLCVVKVKLGEMVIVVFVVFCLCVVCDCINVWVMVDL